MMLASVLAPLGLVWHGAAEAQLAPAETIWSTNFAQGGNGSYDRGANVSVRQRPRPEYDALGIHTGGFMVYPKMNVGLT